MRSYNVLGFAATGDEANRNGSSVVEPMRALVARMGRFASEALKIDLSGEGR